MRGHAFKRNSGTALFLSITIHSLVLFALVYRFSFKKSQNLSLILIELTPKPSQNSVTSQVQRAQTRKPPQRANQNPVPLKNLGIPFPHQTHHPENRAATKSPSQLTGKLLHGSGFSGGNAYQVLTDKHLTLHKYIYQAIDNNLTYPSEFQDARIQGRVVAKIYFNPRGEYVRSQSQFESSQRYLNVHTIRTLRKVFAEPLPPSVKRPQGAFVVHCAFRYLLQQYEDTDLKKSEKLIVGDHLFFYRSAYQSSLEFDVGPIKFLGPLAQGIDPTWFYKMGEKLFSNKATIDPLQKYRDDPDW
jgi:hypothetical protein